MEATEFETDALLKLLTDALRRGPGSPEWHDALQQLRTSGVNGADEMRLLVTVRERLEAGQDYRKISAGPGFTSELFSKINDGDGAAQPARRPLVAITVATLSLIVVIISAAALTRYLSAKPERDPAIDQLANQLFVNPTFRLTFDKPGNAGLVHSGELKVESSAGLRIANVGPDKPGANGIALLKHGGTLDLASGTCVEAEIRVNRTGDASTAIVLWPGDVADPTSVRFVFSIDGNGFAVTHGGVTDRVARSIQPGAYTLRLKIAGDVAIAEVGGREIWSGKHGLKESTAHLGIQFEKTGKSPGDIRVLSLRELKP